MLSQSKNAFSVLVFHSIDQIVYICQILKKRMGI